MRTLQEELKCMREGLHYDAHTPEMYAYRAEVKKKLHQLNVTEYHTSKMPEVTRSLFPNSAPDFFVEPPFYCDYGYNIEIGETAQHPLDADERDAYENCLPVTIGERCWIGGHATICPGVTIGDRCVIGAGSVVTHDIPADSLAVGNPAKVIRKLNQK